MTRRWFGPKRYGWGWTPVTREGWAITLAVVAAPFATLLVARSLTDSEIAASIAVLVTAGVATVLVVVVAILTGDRPRWRWGGRD